MPDLFTKSSLLTPSLEAEVRSKALVRSSSSLRSAMQCPGCTSHFRSQYLVLLLKMQKDMWVPTARRAFCSLHQSIISERAEIPLLKAFLDPPLLEPDM